MIQEHLMAPGTGTLALVPDAPLSVTSAILDAVEGVGAHIVITPAPAVVELGDALLDMAVYTGRVTARPTRTTINLTGLASWLDTYLDAAVSRTSGTPAQWLGDLLDNGLTVGDTAGSNVTRSLPAHIATHRECLDDIAQRGGWEWRINPDFSADAGPDLFTDPPEVVVTRHEEGDDGDLIGIDGGVIDQNVTADAQPTKAVLLGSGSGDLIYTGLATTTRDLNGPDGSAAKFVDVINSPSTDSDGNTVAADYLALQGVHRKVQVSSTTPSIRAKVQPGDHVWLYDPASGLVDTTNVVSFRGDIITPAKVRVLSLSWPIEQGCGVYMRTNEASPEWRDLTPWVAWETGDARWEVGDWSPPGYGTVNRRNPEVEQRISGDALSTYTPSLTAVSTNPTLGSGATATGEYVTAGNRVSGHAQIQFGSSPSAGSGTYRISLPVTPSVPGNASGGVGSPIGTWTARDAGSAFRSGVLQNAGGGEALLLLESSALSHNNPWTWAEDDRINIAFDYLA